MAIDRADWHYGADDFPEDAPEENGATHIGWFVRWAIGRGLFTNEESGTPDLVIEAVRSGTMSGRDLVLEHMDGKLWASDLTEEGQAFAEAHYEAYQMFLGQLSIDLDLDSAYYLEDSEENYKTAAAALERLWTSHKGS